jgi:hypothetical protein
MQLPNVSVIMPCYRATATLETAVQSVLAQSFADFELLIIDDGSPDDTLAVARALAQSDQRIRVLTQANAGPAAARNTGVAVARANVLAFLDADDRWEPELLARHLAHFRADPACGVSFARVRFYDPAMQRAGSVSAAAGRLTLAAILGENPICTTSNIVAQRTVFTAAGNFDTTLTHGEDQEWVARVLATTHWAVQGLPDILVHYRTSPAGLSADLPRMRNGWMAVMERVAAYAPRETIGVTPEVTAMFHRYLARRALRTGQFPQALRPMWQAWRASPRAMLTRQPHRTLMTMLGLCAALLPGNPARALLAR